MATFESSPQGIACLIGQIVIIIIIIIIIKINNATHMGKNMLTVSIASGCGNNIKHS